MDEKDHIVPGAVPTGRVPVSAVRIGQFKYGPNGERIPNLGDGNARAGERRKRDEINRGGPMAQLHQQNAAGASSSMTGGTQQMPSASQSGRTVGDWAQSGAAAGMGLLGGLAGTAAQATRTQASVNNNQSVMSMFEPPAGARQARSSSSTGTSLAEAIHPSNILKGGGMNSTGHFQTGGFTAQGEARRTYTTPTGMQALEARFPGYSQMTPQERAATLRGGRSFNQVGRVVDRGRVGNRGTAVAGGGMLLDNTPGRGGGAVTGSLYARHMADPMGTFRQQFAGGPRPAPAAQPASAVASAPASSSPSGDLWGKPMSLWNVGAAPINNGAVRAAPVNGVGVGGFHASPARSPSAPRDSSVAADVGRATRQTAFDVINPRVASHSGRGTASAWNPYENAITAPIARPARKASDAAIKGFGSFLRGILGG